jgi:RNA polymerase sigma-70 factor (ECF subfamily)
VTPAKSMDEGRDKGRPPSLRVLAGGATPARREEEALVAAFLVGDDEAFGELVRRHEPLVLALVRRYARTPEDARDLAQRTFLRAFEAARRALRGPRHQAVPFRRWLVRVAVNLAKNHLRDEGRFTRTPLEALGASEGEAPVAADTLLHAERAARLRREVLRLPRRQREVLTLRLDAELPFAEIALALGITENAAKVTFHHASRRLREVLSPKETP